MAKINDPAVMRALAHPARMAIMEHLTATRQPSTATECAEVVDLSPSAVSYHLRALAKSGLIEEAPSRGDGRERLWQTQYRGMAVSAEQGAPPETQAAEMAMVNAFLARSQQRILDWFVGAHAEPSEWYRVAFMNETVLNITAEELEALTGKITALLEPYRRVERQSPPAGSRLVSMQVRAVPIRR